MKKPLRLLIVEDSEFDALLLVNVLRKGGYAPEFLRVDNREAMSAALKEKSWDLVLSDYNMPNFSMFEALQLLQQSGRDLPFIIVSGGIGEDIAVAAMKAGADDYLMKGNLARLVPAVERELREAANRDARRQAEAALSKSREQLRVAREIQQRLFPKHAPDCPGFDLAGASFPAEATGGDYFDFVRLLKGGLGIVVGDVSGHGIGPALLMAETRAYLRLLARNREDLGEILVRANRIIAEDVSYERFVTLLLARLDPPARLLTYASAGHPPGYVLDSSGALKHKLQRTGIPLGLQPDAHYASAPPIRLAAGDLLLLLTDGVEETMSPKDEFFGMDRTLSVIREHQRMSAHEIVEALYQAARSFAQNAPQLDDVTVVVAKAL